MTDSGKTLGRTFYGNATELDDVHELPGFSGVFFGKNGNLFRHDSQGFRESLPQDDMDEIGRSLNYPNWKPGDEIAAMAPIEIWSDDALEGSETDDHGIADQVNDYYAKIGSGKFEMPQSLIEKLTLDYQQYLFRLTGG